MENSPPPVDCTIRRKKCQNPVSFSFGIYVIFNISSIWFTCLVNCICEKTLSPDPAKLRIMI